MLCSTYSTRVSQVNLVDPQIPNMCSSLTRSSSTVARTARGTSFVLRTTSRSHSASVSRQQRLVVAMSGGRGPSAVPKTETIPIFPLSLVALPNANVPLQIFEARYRVLFSTLLAGADGIDEGLVSEEKPWLASRRFGMALSTDKGICSVGTVLEITQHDTMEDGRILINTIGRERFKILDVVEERPVLVAKIEYMHEDDDDSAPVVELKEDVSRMFVDTFKLSVKLREAEAGTEVKVDSQEMVDKMQVMSARELSFWIASMLAGNPFQQQTLLEEESTVSRLTAEQELLSNTLKYLSAQVALQSAFPGSGPSSLDF